MAKENLYHGELQKNEDWGSEIKRIEEGVEVTYDRAAGDAVQNFLKKTLNNKWGSIYDNSKGKYYVFTDEESKDIYVDAIEQLQPGQTEDDLPEYIKVLKLAEMNSYSNYRIVIELDTEHTMPSNAVLLGQTGNKIVFTANTYDKDDNTLLEGLTINYTITRPDHSKTVITHFAQSGKEEELNVDEYIAEGENTVAINVVGGMSNAIANMTIFYYVVSLSVSDNYDISTVHNLVDNPTSTLSINWTVKGSSDTSKFVEWYIDGVLQEQPDPIPSGKDEGITVKYINIDNSYAEGRHNIQYRAWLTVNGKKFYTSTYSKDFIVYKGGSKPIIAISYEIPVGYEPLTGDTYLNPIIYNCMQYVGFKVPVAVFKNENTLYVDTTLELKYEKDGVWKTDSSTSIRVQQYETEVANITPGVFGETKLVITAGDSAYEIATIVDENKNIHE